jgi:hypothetical protein
MTAASPATTAPAAATAPRADAVAHAPQADPRWDVIAYEVRMFRATYDIVLDRVALAQLPKVLANAVEESAVLHTRLLCDVFLSKAIAADDIQLPQLFPGWYSHGRYSRVKSKIRALRHLYRTSQVKDSYCWVFNKMMAHPTAHRGISYDYTAILARLRPAIAEIIAEIERLRGQPFTWSW